MESERWKRVDNLLQAALEHPPAGRAEFLRQACAGDEALEREVHSLVASEEAAGGFLLSPAIEAAAKAMVWQPGIDLESETSASLTGQTISHYRIMEKLGEGGMGAVWKARDTRLDRFVALKVLPETRMSDPERKRRFVQEARAASALNHPNIITIYDIGQEHGIDFIAMEFVPGRALNQLIPRKGMRLNEALKYAIEIADALVAAHTAGIVHRDLKPGNVMVNENECVKVLDFGLAKLTERSGERESARTETLAETPKTGEGMIVGTASYMSPEQADGKHVDARTDIFSFGALLYEMITGRRAFGGDSMASILSAILRDEPKRASEIAPHLPHALDRIVTRCLQKDPSLRYQHAGDLKIDLQHVREETAAVDSAIREQGDVRVALEEGAPAALTAERLASKLAWPVAGVLAVALMLASVLLWRSTQRSSHPLLRFTDDVGTAVEAEPLGIALSPDGMRAAFVSSAHTLYVRFLDNPKSAAALSGTDGATYPFFSPDGAWIGFFARGKLKKVAVQGGAPITLCDATNILGASWGDDGTIVFTPDNRSGLLRVPEAGGKPALLTKLDAKSGELTHRFPQVLPGARAVLFTAGTPGNYEDATIEAQVFRTGERKTVYRGGYHGRYLPSGHLVYLHEGNLFAASMDLNRLELTGPPTPILDDVSSSPSSAAAGFDLSQSGTMAYIPAGDSQLSFLAWMDESGKIERMSAPLKPYVLPVSVSPDGTRLAVVLQDGSFRNLWVYDWKRDRIFPITFGKGVVYNPSWSPDGKHLAFGATGGGFSVPGIYWVRADGAGRPERLIDLVSAGLSSSSKVVISFSPGGERMAFTGNGRILTTNLNWSDPENPIAGKPESLLTGQRGSQPAFSPDGHFMAYMSEETGRSEVYAASFPGPGGRWLVSSGGGRNPVWSHNGRELFYQAVNGRIMIVTYASRVGSFEADPPNVWADRVLPLPNNGLAPDGRRFAVALPAQESGPKSPSHLVFLLNFFDELRRKVPPK